MNGGRMEGGRERERERTLEKGSGVKVSVRVERTIIFFKSPLHSQHNNKHRQVRMYAKTIGLKLLENNTLRASNYHP